MIDLGTSSIYYEFKTCSVLEAVQLNMGFDYPCDRQGYYIATGYKTFFPVNNFVHTTHILDSFMYWAFLLQQTFFEHVRILNIRPDRNLLFLLFVILPTRFVKFSKYFFGLIGFGLFNIDLMAS